MIYAGVEIRRTNVLLDVFGAGFPYVVNTLHSQMIFGLRLTRAETAGCGWDSKRKKDTENTAEVPENGFTGWCGYLSLGLSMKERS